LNDTIDIFTQTIDKVLGAFRKNRPVTLQPSPQLSLALETGKQIVTTEINRRILSGKRGGRPRKTK